jgi:hypothetical protein
MSTSSETKDSNSQREPPFPTAQTLFRVVGLSERFEKTLESVFRAATAAETLMTDELVASKRIREAKTPLQLVALTPDSRGVAQLTWTQRMNEFGADAIPAITRRLKSSQSIPDESARHLVVERLIGALRRLGQPGGQTILDCFNNLDTYSQSIASAALGVLGFQPASDLIWRFFQRVKNEPQVGLLVGALWGLIDLHHPGVDQAMADLLHADRLFAEQYPFAALAGGRACAGPLAARLDAALEGHDHYDNERHDITMALIAIGHRLGQDELAVTLRETTVPEEMISSLAHAILTRSPGDIAVYFQMYYDRPGAQTAREG